ncbi:unnamed protein product, partial [marine sediment metagenome]
GSLDIFNINKAIIENKISQTLFLWLLYPLQTSKNQQLEKENLSIFGRTILECVGKNESCTSARLLDNFKQYDEEEILNEIFGLVDKGYLVTSSND